MPSVVAVTRIGTCMVRSSAADISCIVQVMTHLKASRAHAGYPVPVGCARITAGAQAGDYLFECSDGKIGKATPPLILW